MLLLASELIGLKGVDFSGSYSDITVTILQAYLFVRVLERIVEC